jgi:hypothetical protein
MYSKVALPRRAMHLQLRRWLFYVFSEILATNNSEKWHCPSLKRTIFQLKRLAPLHVVLTILVPFLVVCFEVEDSDFRLQLGPAGVWRLASRVPTLL